MLSTGSDIDDEYRVKIVSLLWRRVGNYWRVN